MGRQQRGYGEYGKAVFRQQNKRDFYNQRNVAYDQDKMAQFNNQANAYNSQLGQLGYRSVVGPKMVMPHNFVRKCSHCGNTATERRCESCGASA
jgi:hypothetical protein